MPEDTATTRPGRRELARAFARSSDGTKVYFIESLNQCSWQHQSVQQSLDQMQQSLDRLKASIEGLRGP